MIRFWADRPARRFFVQLLALAGALLAACAVLGAAAAWWVGRQLFAQQAAAATVLLQSDEPPAVVAAAFANARPTAQGLALARQLGRDEIALVLLRAPALWAGFAALALGLGALLAAALLGLAARYLNGCQAAQAGALAVVRRFAAGEHTARLPWDATGTWGELLGAVGELFTALQARSEAERRSRVFLKGTVSDISHQLKTPLAALALYQELLAAEAGDPAAVRRFAQKSADALARMERLIQMLLKLAQLDAGGIRFDTAPHPVAELAAQAAAPLEERARQEGKRLALCGDGALLLHCDAAWTAEALGNLVKNALDHTGPGGRVAVTWAAVPLGVRIAVEDDGCGIPPGDLHHIFKRFYRGAGQGAGIGLGLPLAKAIVEGQGGVLAVQSEPGRGSVFTVSFLTKP